MKKPLFCGICHAVFRKFSIVLARRRVHRVFGLVLCGVLLLLSADVFARAGGGGGFSGGGGGGFGGGGGSGGGGVFAIYLIFRLIEFWVVFCMYHPVIGVPLTIVFLVLAYHAVKASASGATTYHQASTIRRGRSVQDAAARQRATARLLARDPSFDERTLTARIKDAFVKIQNAWSSQDLSTIRPFISDGIYERFSLQIAEQKDRGVRNEMEQIQVLNVEVVQLVSDDMFDTLTVAIDASAVDYDVDLASGKRVSGRTAPETFREYWSFIRRPDAKSLAGGGLIEGNCPNCGSSLTLNEAAACASCGALVKSGQYDWVLAEITQASEWRAETPSEIPGVAALHSDDPGFSVQHVEDRASVMFWRLMEAWRSGKVDSVRKMATEGFSAELAPQLKPDADGTRRHPVDCAVGGVRTLGVVLAEPFDRALIEIRWSGGQVQRDRSGKTRRTAGASVKTDIFVLIRKHGVKADAGKALSSAHCPGCGAAVHSSDADACEYCGSVLNDGSSDWVLSARKAPYDPEIAELRREMTRVHTADSDDERAAVESGHVPNGLELAAWMTAVMLADGKVDEKERALLRDYGVKRGIPEGRIDWLISAVNSGRLEGPEPQSTQEARQWLGEMAGMALADGFIDRGEKQALAAFGKHLGFTEYDLNQIISQKRREIYQATKSRIRAAKKTGGSDDWEPHN